MVDQQERAVARRLTAGDPRAWESLYDQYCEQIWRCVARLVGSDSHAVGDIVQETFLAAARSARDYSADRGSLWNWLHGIARKQTALHYRKQRRTATLTGTEWMAEQHDELRQWLVSGGETPEQLLERAELADLVRVALLEISADHAQLLTAKYLDGASVAEIAGPAGLSSTAVRSKLARARNSFRIAFLRIASRSDFGMPEKKEHEV